MRHFSYFKCVRSCGLFLRSSIVRQRGGLRSIYIKQVHILTTATMIVWKGVLSCCRISLLPFVLGTYCAQSIFRDFSLSSTVTSWSTVRQGWINIWILIIHSRWSCPVEGRSACGFDHIPFSVLTLEKWRYEVPDQHTRSLEKRRETPQRIYDRNCYHAA